MRTVIVVAALVMIFLICAAAAALSPPRESFTQIHLDNLQNLLWTDTNNMSIYIDRARNMTAADKTALGHYINTLKNAITNLYVFCNERNCSNIPKAVIVNIQDIINTGDNSLAGFVGKSTSLTDVDKDVLLNTYVYNLNQTVAAILNECNNGVCN
jgi:hypothetical protein